MHQPPEIQWWLPAALPPLLPQPPEEAMDPANIAQPNVHPAKVRALTVKPLKPLFTDIPEDRDTVVLVQED